MTNGDRQPITPDRAELEKPLSDFLTVSTANWARLIEQGAPFKQLGLNIAHTEAEAVEIARLIYETLRPGATFDGVINWTEEPIYIYAGTKNVVFATKVINNPQPNRLDERLSDHGDPGITVHDSILHHLKALGHSVDEVDIWMSAGTANTDPLGKGGHYTNSNLAKIAISLQTHLTSPEKARKNWLLAVTARTTNTMPDKPTPTELWTKTADTVLGTEGRFTNLGEIYHPDLPFKLHLLALYLPSDQVKNQLDKTITALQARASTYHLSLPAYPQQFGHGFYSYRSQKVTRH